MTARTGGCACAQVRFTATGAPQRMPDIVMVMAGALDDPSTITPTMLVYGDERIPWDHARVEADG